MVEGVLAETGYHVYGEVLRSRSRMPGMFRIVDHLKSDESRHLAYGVHLLTRLVAEHGEPVWRAVVERMEELLDPALGIIHETFEQYDPDDVPFALKVEDFLDFAVDQFRRRLARVELARGATAPPAIADVGDDA